MRRLLVGLPVLFAAACGEIAPDTLVTELRVMAIVPDAPEIAPGESTAIEVVAFAPVADAARLWTWSCAATPDGTCQGDPEVVDALVDTPVAHAPAELVATEAPAPLVAVWVYACEADCAPPPSSALADPTAFMADQPLTGTSLAVRALRVSTRADRHVNPELLGPDGLGAWAPGEVVPLAFTVDGDLGAEATAWGYATAGGFAVPSTPATDGGFELPWVAPDEAGPVHVVVVVEDGLGGVAVWQAG